MTRLLTRFTLAVVLVLARAGSIDVTSSRGCSASRLGETSTCSNGTTSGCWSGAATTSGAGCSLVIGRGAASILGFRMTRLLTRFTLAAVLVLNRAGSFGFCGVTLSPPSGLARPGFGRRVLDSGAAGMGETSSLGLRTTRLLTDFTLAAVLVLGLAGSLGFFAVSLSPSLGSAGMGLRRRVFDSSATGMGEASSLGFRMSRLLTGFTLAAVLVLGRTGSLGFFVVSLSPSLGSAGMGFRRRVFGMLRVTRRIVRAAGFTAFPERGFFVFIPGCYPFGGYRILSDASYFTAAARAAQRETEAEKVGNLVSEPAKYRASHPVTDSRAIAGPQTSPCDS